MRGQKTHRSFSAYACYTIAAIVPKLAVLWRIGVIVLVAGVIQLILGRMGRPVGRRRHDY